MMPFRGDDQPLPPPAPDFAPFCFAAWRGRSQPTRTPWSMQLKR